jgi:DNA-binding SARP family transcriptional activator
VSEPLRYELLGPLRVLRGSAELPVGGPQQRQLLALLVNANCRSVATTKLIDEIWGEDPHDKARNSIQQYVHHLRGQVGDALETVPGGYALDSSGAVDTAEFEALLKASENMRPVQRASKLGDALNLWRGEAFVDFADCEWAKPLILRLSELRAGALEDQAEAFILSGEPLDSMAVVVPQIREHPLRDRPRALLMRSFAAQGRHTEALRSWPENLVRPWSGAESAWISLRRMATKP